MTQENQTQDKTEAELALEGDGAKDDLQQPDELSVLKARAKMLGIVFSNNIGLESLKTKIAAKLADDEAAAGAQEQNQENEQDDEESVGTNTPAALTVAQRPDPVPETPAKPKKALTLRQMIYKKQMALVRVRITNLDPKKKDLPGEIITVANKFLGTVRKFVPYGEQTENGYHVPFCIYTFLESRKFLNIRMRKGHGGMPVPEQTWAREFALEILDPLTEAELKELAAAQIAAGSTNAVAD